MASRPVPFAPVALALGVLLVGGRARSASAGEPSARGYQGPDEVATDVALEAVPEVAPEQAPSEAAPEVAPEQPTVEIPADTAPPRSSEPQVWMPRHRLIYRNFTAGRVNPPGLVNETTLGYRRQFVARNSPLFLDSFALVGGHAYVTPAFVRVGPTVEFQPLAALNLGVTYDFVGAFGNLGQIQSFASPTDRAGPDEFSDNKAAGRHYATWGHLVTLSALLQAKVKRIVLRTSTKAYWSDLRLRNGDRVYYDQSLDIVVPDRGWSIINETDFIYLFDKGLRLLVRHSLTHAFYERRHFMPGEPVSQPNGPTSRLGPAVAFTFFDRPGVRFNKPTVFLLSQWWLRHRWRTGEQVSAGIPYAAVGFAFEGDLVPYRKDVARKPRRRSR